MYHFSYCICVFFTLQGLLHCTCIEDVLGGGMWTALVSSVQSATHLPSGEITSNHLLQSRAYRYFIYSNSQITQTVYLGLSRFQRDGETFAA